MSKICSVDGCVGKIHSHKLCNKHSHRLSKYGDPLFIPERSRLLTLKECKINDCCNKPVSKGYCRKHHRSYKLYNDPLLVEAEKIKNTPKEYYGTKLYRVYYGMIQRCTNPKNIAYKDYGGRGITVCDFWMKSYMNFHNDMYNSYVEGLEIDRKENNKNYNFENCHWISKVENRRKTRGVKLNIEKAREIRNLYKTQKITHEELAEKFKVYRTTITSIINNKLWKEI